MPKAAKYKTTFNRQRFNISLSSENRQFVVVLLMGIVFCFVIVFLLWLQSVRPAEPLASYLAEETRLDYPQISFWIEGVKEMGVEIPVRLVIYNNSLGKEEYSGAVWVRSNDQGIFSGTISGLAVPTYDDYTFLVKGPKHKQIKIENIQLSVAGFDLTDRTLPPGDLPWNGEQDKMVNMDDYDALVMRIGSSDKTDVDIADLDYNGVVNEIDRSLMLKTFMNH